MARDLEFEIDVTEPREIILARFEDAIRRALAVGDVERRASERHPSVQGWWPVRCPQRQFVEGAKWWQFHKNGSTMWATEREEAEAEAVRRFGEPQAEASPALGDVEFELRAVCEESNAVCVCGCPLSEHENYGEDGEGCEHDDHECIRTSKAVYAIVAKLRQQLADRAVGDVEPVIGRVEDRTHE